MTYTTEKYSLDAVAAKLADTMMTKYRAKHPENTEIVSTDKLVQTVQNYALAAAAAGLGVSWLPGIGGIAATGAMITFIWSMYFRINECLGLKFSTVALKSLAAAFLTNLGQAAVYVVGTTLLSTALSLTGIGNLAASLMMAALDYAVLIVSGILYLRLITSLVEIGRDPESLSEDELKECSAELVKGENVRKALANEIRNYKAGRKNGSISGEESVELPQGAEA